MTFTYVYRDQTGMRREATIEAASRADCRAQLRERGVQPLAVREGKCTVDVRGEGRPRLWRGVLAGMAAVALAISGWFFWNVRGDGKAGTEERAKPAARNRHSVQTSTNVSTKTSHEKKLRALARKREKKDGPKPIGGNYEIVSVVTNDAGFILTTVVDTKGQKSIITETVKPTIFKNPMHQLIAAAIGGASDSTMAPLPLGPGDDAALRAALKIDIPDLPDDSEEIRKLKSAVRATKQEMGKLLDQGMSVNEILTQHRDLWNDNVNIRREMKDEYRRILREGDEEGAAHYLEKINEAMSGMGIPAITPEEVRVKSRKKGKRKVEER